MFVCRRTSVLALTLALFALPQLGAAQTSSAPPPVNYIHVDALFAQRLTADTKARHPEIKKLGLHATPPGGTDNAIIGSDTPAKIGKRSSIPDMQHLALNKPVATRIEKDGIYDLLLPLTDAKGGDLGSAFLVMEVPFDRAPTEADALKIGLSIRDEFQSRIPSRNALYER